MDRLQKASFFFFYILTIENNTWSVRILAALQHNENPQPIQAVDDIWFSAPKLSGLDFRQRE